MAEAGSLGVFTSTEEAEWNEAQEKSPRRDSISLSKARSEELALRSEELALGSCTRKRGSSGNEK